MNRYLIIIFSLMMVIIFSGCSQKRIAQVSEPQQITDSKGIKDKDSTKGADSLKEGQKESIQKETIAEKEIAKVQPADILQTEKELQIKISDVYFDFNQYDIKEDAKPVLKELSSMLLKNNKLKVIVEGHCDERGTNEYNLALGEKRANSVKEYLIALGVPSNRINTVSYGEEKPVCTEQTEECWAKNRRAHFVFIEAVK